MVQVWDFWIDRPLRPEVNIDENFEARLLIPDVVFDGVRCRLGAVLDVDLFEDIL